ncbi:MAG: hypothetical protein K6L76_01140 [Agarilytica sp.]
MDKPNTTSTLTSSNEKTEWSYVSETVNMLYLAVCQIETTMSDANKEVNTLTDSFTHLASHTQEIAEQLKSLSGSSEIDHIKDDVSSTATELQDKISRSISAFQFYDRVCQRIDHVARSLEKVSTILEDNEHLERRDSWHNIQEQIKSSYTMEAERIMFEFIMRGGNVKEALEIYNHHFDQSKADQDDDEVELF